MAKRRARIFETKYFSLIIAALVFGIFFVLANLTVLFDDVEHKVLDLHFFLKNTTQKRLFQEGVSVEARNPKVSEDISIIGIDLTSLNDYGKWPFPRYRFADLINAFSRIKRQEMRESALFIDVFFSDMDTNPADDALLESAMTSSNRVFLETVLRLGFSTSMDEDEYWKRLELLEEKNGKIKSIKGDWQDMPDNFGFEAPLQPFAKAVAGYGHANYTEDRDGIYRRQGLIAKIPRVLERIDVLELVPGFTADESSFERLAWKDLSGTFHFVKSPVTAESLEILKKELPRKSPPLRVDADGDGETEKDSFIVYKIRDSFMPAITLSLALNYFHRSIEDAEIVLGEYIRIPEPLKWDPETKEWKPYQIQLTPDSYDKDSGEVSKAGKRITLGEIKIPIDKYGRMLINYMGPPSSESGEGVQTYPVRSFSGYANMVKPPDESLWRSSMASSGKIQMVGAFSQGMAQDEKPSPFGLMYGIEIHANALNTILMDNFIIESPLWLNALILFAVILLVSVASSRLPSFISLGIVLVLVGGGFFGITSLFDSRSYLLPFSTSAIAAIFVFITIIVYRAMTEEKDKRVLRDMFGKYVSPDVVNQLVEDPPELGGVDKELTVFFSDIRGFSTLSENMSPQELVNHLNVYLAAMTDLVLEYGGTLDKYIGDAIMAFWGAPLPMADHAKRSCECALKQMEKLRELNALWPPERKLDIGIGLNSGIMTVGNMGSSLRMNYTLMGDNVNLGSRLEGTNKEYGTNIIVSEFTYGLVKDDFIFRELDVVRVKGKNKPVMIYELVAVK
jgi:adenylate cyclase